MRKREFKHFMITRYRCWCFLWCVFAPLALGFPLTGNIEPCFTPGENCTQRIVDAIEHAQKTLWIQAYQFTSIPIRDAVLRAKDRGVDVKVILDKTQCNRRIDNAATCLNQAHIPVWIDYKVSIAHNKVMIIDDKYLISGSFNFSQSAQTKNAENVLLIESESLAKAYAHNWQCRQRAAMDLAAYVALKQSQSHCSKGKTRKKMKI